MRNFIYILIGFLGLNTNAQLINDESYLDLEFLKFKTELLHCVIQKDKEKLKGFLANRVLESKDTCGYPGCTKDEFIKYYFEENSEESWKNMLTILRFGFSRVEDENPNNIIPHDKIIFQGPSYLKKVDRDNEIIVIGENVNIREKPSLKGKVIRRSSFEKFSCDCNIITMKKSTYQTVDEINWLEIKLKSGQVGYISAELTSYSLIKEMTIAKIDGKWKIISFFNSPGC
ncbi:SH3 domain-containing protein [Aquimarina algiphila]|uniref:SH3 domain-containing protein n=1 Tax=Aquimarina algiphila TaxID=2047982 RepID=UPI00232E8F58|nr:SH3 domain-containing protein [Aquimarina algiphila]